LQPEKRTLVEGVANAFADAYSSIYISKTQTSDPRVHELQTSRLKRKSNVKALRRMFFGFDFID
jgi:hypothetical protein